MVILVGENELPFILFIFTWIPRWGNPIHIKKIRTVERIQTFIVEYPITIRIIFRMSIYKNLPTRHQRHIPTYMFQSLKKKTWNRLQYHYTSCHVIMGKKLNQTSGKTSHYHRLKFQVMIPIGLSYHYLLFLQDTNAQTLHSSLHFQSLSCHQLECSHLTKTFEIVP